MFETVAALGAASEAISCEVDDPPAASALALTDVSGRVSTLLVGNRTAAALTVVVPDLAQHLTVAPFGFEIVDVRPDTTPAEKGTR